MLNNITGDSVVNVTINVLYDELRRVHKELHELRGSLIPTEKISKEEHAELDNIFEEMRKGKATPWREALKQ